MKKLLLIFIFAISAIPSFPVGFRSIGTKASVCAYTFDGQYYLILSFKESDDYLFLGQPIIKFLMSDGSVITLDGSDESVKYKTKSINWGYGVTTAKTKAKHYALIPITKETIAQIQKGVEGVAINTIPKVYKCSSWVNKKNFGQQLYEDFMNLKDDFEKEKGLNDDDNEMYN